MNRCLLTRHLFAQNFRASVLLLTLCCCLAYAPPLGAQTPAARTDAAPSPARRSIVRRDSKLPSPDQVISAHVKRIGGRKRLRGVSDAVYEWDVARAPQSVSTGTARLLTARTGALRFDLIGASAPDISTAMTPAAVTTNSDRANTAAVFAATPRLAWTRAADGATRTLIDKESAAARLFAALFADRTFDYKRARALARTVARDESVATKHTEAAHVVEFTARDNTRLRAWFGTESHRLLRLAGGSNAHAIDFYDYRVSADGGAQIAEPHRIEITSDSATSDESLIPPLVLTLRTARYNNALAASVFDAPPAADVALDALLREVTRRQRRADASLGDYTYRVRQSETTLGKGGVISKESSTTWEIYQLVNWQSASKRVLVDDRPLAPAEAAKEDAQLAAHLEALEKLPPIVMPPPSDEQNEERPGVGFAINIEDFSLRLTDIMRISEFVSPRRETLHDRDSIVFDFRPRAGFRPKNREEEVINKLRGVIWIDAADKLVTRFEAQLTDGFKIGGGLLASIRPGAGLVYEAQRLPEGLWMPRFTRLNANGRALLFSEINVLTASEWSDFKRFRTSTDAGIIVAPTIAPEPQF